VDEPDTRDVWDANAPVWIELTRAGFDTYRDLINTPAFMDMLPDVNGRLGLDVGCGEGHNTRLVAERGADLAALDVSRPFVSAAAEHERSAPLGIRYVLSDARSLPIASNSLDFVTAFMSLMDVADPDAALREIARVLRPHGFVQFSIGHPFTTTPIRRWLSPDKEERDALAIGEYFYEGPLEDTWIFRATPEKLRRSRRPFRIVYARRTLAGWLNAVIRAGLVIEAVAEPCADDETADRHPEVADSRVAPYFLLVRARQYEREGQKRIA
jgi:SAM-dependent methyltransferase